MTTVWKLEHDVFIYTGEGVVIPDYASFWELNSETKIDFLYKAKTLYLLANDAEFLTQFNPNRRIESWAIHEYPQVIEISKTINKNPFADEKIKKIAELVLEAYWREKKKRSPGKRLRAKVIDRDQSICRYCGSSLTDGEIEIDHIVPYSLGGKTELENLVVSCAECNFKKFDKPLEECLMELHPIGFSNGR